MCRKTGNPARRCRLSFASKIDKNISKIKYGDNQAVKLDYELIKVRGSVSTIELCKKNEHISWLMTMAEW